MSCQIVLDNPGTYHPGGSVYGRVVCNFSSKKKLRCIRCTFLGKEHTAWSERESYQDFTSRSINWKIVHYSGDNTFLFVNINLVGESLLPAGHYEYPFSFIFPRYNIPNPYNGNYGSIRYYLKATVEIPFAFDYKDEVTLNLISPINFNDISNELQMKPVAYQDEKTIYCCCSAGDPITMNLVLDKEAFVVGEVAKVKVEITNMSNKSIQELNLSLEMTVISKTTSPKTRRKYKRILIATSSAAGVGAHGQRTYNINFRIPQSTVIPNFAGCYLFKQWCVLKADAVIECYHTNLDFDIGVKLGHIPIKGALAPVTIIPPNQALGGAFSPPPPIFAYHAHEKVPPYSSGSSMFPLPKGNDSDFKNDVVAPLLPGKEMPLPVQVHGECSSSAPLGDLHQQKLN